VSVLGVQEVAHAPPPPHAKWLVQSAAVVQPHVWFEPPLETQFRFVAPAVQLVHAPAESPHVAGCESSAQVPAAQQAPLHGCVPSHVVLHELGLPVEPRQACTVGHSVSEVQPQLPPPATASHVLPTLLLTHDPQMPPAEPHAACAVPCTQVPWVPPSLISQHPPLQSCVTLHAVVQAWVVVLQAWSAGQSVAELQPQTFPVTHCLPELEPLQSWHCVPAAPHDVCWLSATTHEPAEAAEQHAPAHG
jgi:hypothetical protein